MCTQCLCGVWSCACLLCLENNGGGANGPRLQKTKHTPTLIDGAVVEQVENFKFLGVHITKLTWPKHTKTVVKRAQHLFPLMRLKRFGMEPQILKRFYSCTGFITAWYANCSASNARYYRG